MEEPNKTEEVAEDTRSHGEKLVEEHRKMLIFSGNISDFQLNNITNWSWVLFDNLKEAKVDYNFVGDKEDEDDEDLVCAGTVRYIWTFKTKTKKEDILKQIADITQWTKFLFWKDTKVEVEIKNGSRRSKK